MALRMSNSVADVIRIANLECYDAYSQSEIFATVNVMILNPHTQQLEQANAGHTPTLLRLGGTWTEWEASVPPLGILPELAPSIHQTTLEDGDLVICYSDGLSEIDTGPALWGLAGLRSAVANVDVHAAPQIAAEIMAEAQSMEQTDGPHDDQTLIVIASHGL